MKLFKQLFHFLGGLPLAIALIAIAALTVVVGTLIESQTGSHLLAAHWTYENPFFFLLLSLFFINILFAALRRWPFKKRHIPFLLTHLGLLMIISGTMIKNHWGLQGQLTVWEGSGNQHVLLPHTYALSIQEKKQDQEQAASRNEMLTFDSFRPKIYYPFHFPHLQCKIIGYAPHVKAQFETWIKKSHAYIAGFPPIPVYNWEPSQIFPEAASYRFALADDSPIWSILAVRSSHVHEALKQAYLQELNLQLKTKDSSEKFEIPLHQALNSPFSFAQGHLNVLLHLPFPFEEENAVPALNLIWKSQAKNVEEIFTIPLQGQDALLLKPHSDLWSVASFTVDLRRPNPLLCLVEDDQDKNVFVFAFDSYGRMHSEIFNSSHLQTIASYDQGFGGYGVQAIVPISSFPASREDKEKADAYALTLQLQQALTQQPVLAPPLHFFEQACRQAQLDFSKTLVHFLIEWHAQPGFLFHSDEGVISDALLTFLQHLNWQEISQHDKQSIQWVNCIFSQLEASWKQGNHPLNILERQHWPFIEELKQASSSTQHPAPLNLLAQQISSLIGYFPPLDFPDSLSPIEQARFLSAYLRAYGIDYRSLVGFRGKGKEQFDILESYWKAHVPSSNSQQTIIFETSLTHRVIPEIAPAKPEDQRPGIVLEVQQGQHQQTIALAYDPSGVGLKWPILNGNYLIGFQPKLQELPYRIRLRQARQIYYPQSSQVYSYESDLLILENGKPPQEQTLSMNHVYETWDGYRFYLAGIGHSADSNLKHIQLAVNYDPAKYFLTYPGAVLVFLGIILLFWIYPPSGSFGRFSA
jgi:hypothetical protein